MIYVLTIDWNFMYVSACIRIWCFFLLVSGIHRDPYSSIFYVSICLWFLSWLVFKLVGILFFHIFETLPNFIYEKLQMSSDFGEVWNKIFLEKKKERTNEIIYDQVELMLCLQVRHCPCICNAISSNKMPPILTCYKINVWFFLV